MITNNVTFAMLQAAMQNTENNAVKKSHAVGDVIMRFNNNNPALDFGGMWERTAQGRFPLGASSTGVGVGWLLGAEGGEAKHTLTIQEMPSHVHQADYRWSTGSQGAGFGIVVGAPNEGRSDLVEETGGGVAHNNMPPM